MQLGGDIGAQIRACGAVIDLAFTQELYKPLLVAQPRHGVKVERDLSYGRDARHLADIYTPEKRSDTPHPAIILFHGGGFVRGSKQDRENAGLFFARQGFVVVAANYRLAPEPVAVRR
jgi:acetyl esterase